MFLLGAFQEATFAGVLFFPPEIWDAESRIILDNVSRLFGLSLFVLGHFSLLGMGLRLSIKWAGVFKFFGLTIAPQNPAVQLLGRRGGFWCPWAFIMACQVLSSINARASSLV